MRDVVLLLKIQLLGLFGLNKALHTDRARAKRSIALFVLAVVGIGVLCAGYSVGVAVSLSEFGLGDAIPFIAVLVGSLAGAIATFIKANGVLFAFKDYDLVMSLPVKTVAVVVSRLAALYSISLLFAAIVMIPAFAVYFVAEGATVATVVMALASVFLSPLLPMALAVLVAVGISALASRMRHANIVTVVLSIAAVLVVVVVPYALMGSAGGDVDELAAFGAQQIAAMQDVLFPIGWASEGIAGGNAVLYLAFAALAAVGATAMVLIVSWRFTAINSLLTASRPHGDFSLDKAKTTRVASPFAALLAKEARRLAATPIYLLNSCMGYVLALVAAIAAVVASASGMLPEELFSGGLDVAISLFLPWAVALLVGMTSTTAPSVSLEGKSRWLMYTAPVPVRTLYGAKIALNLAIAIPTALVVAVLLAIAFRVDVLSAVLTALVPATTATFMSVLGLAIDASRPRFDWTSEYEPVKRSIAVMATVFASFVVIAIGMVAASFAGAFGTIAITGILALFAWLLFKRTVSEPLHD